MMVTVETHPCIVCGEATVLELDAYKFERWQRGEYVQVVWPDWSPAKRELLITGTHGSCWEEMFADEEE